MPTVNTTLQRRGYLSKQGYVALDRVMHMSCRLYNAALENFRNSYPRRWVTVPAETGKGLTFDGSQWQRNKATGVWFNEVGDPLRVTGQEPDASLYAMYNQLTGIRADDPQWAALDTLIGRGVLQRLQRAKNDFFRRCRDGQKPGYPRFKSVSRWRTIELAEVRPGMVRRNKIRVKGLPTITLRGDNLPDSSQFRTLRITRTRRKLTISLTYEMERDPLPPNTACVGIDMGITDRMTFSNGDTPMDRRQPDRDNIAEKQRRLSRCTKGSRRFNERGRVLANAQERRRIRNRNDCHRVTTDIIRRFGHVAIENLKLRNMTASAQGTVEHPGTNVRAKGGLNREIMAQTWGTIRQQLRYKAEWAGRSLVEVDPRNTSITCSRCSTVDAKSRSGKSFHCRDCRLNIDADLNAAINILRRSLAGGTPAAGLEPAELYT
jgi:putative transposase